MQQSDALNAFSNDNLLELVENCRIPRNLTKLSLHIPTLIGTIKTLLLKNCLLHYTYHAFIYEIDSFIFLYAIVSQ